MNRSSGFIKIALVVFAVIIIGALIGIMATRRADVRPVEPPAMVEPPKPLVATMSPAESSPPRATSPEIRPISRPASPQVIPPTTGDTNIVADWEDRLDEVLGSEAEESVKANQLLALFPKTPAEGQEELARHLANLTEDENYAALGSYLTNSTLPESVLDVLIQDVLNRPNATKLPLLLDVAKEPGHPKAAEARELLELFLDEDYGTDWPKWQAQMQAWLKDNPD